MAKARYPVPRRGEVWWIDLGTTVGHEIEKTRPAVIVTSNVYNQHNWVVLAMPVTTQDTARFDQILIDPPEGGLNNRSVTLPDQLRAIDRARLVQRLGVLRPVTMRKIDQSLKIVLDLR